MGQMDQAPRIWGLKVPRVRAFTPSVLTCHFGFVPQGAEGSNGALSSHSPGQHWQAPAGRLGGRQGPTPGSRQLRVPAPDTAAGTSAGSPDLRVGEGKAGSQLQGNVNERQRDHQSDLETGLQIQSETHRDREDVESE